MLVHGREIGFRFTVGASAKVADLCPEGDISRLGDVLSGGYGTVARDMAAIIAALSEGYEQSRKFAELGYVPNPLTAEELLALGVAEFTALQAEAMAAWAADSKPTVEVEPEKKENGKARTSS